MNIKLKLNGVAFFMLMLMFALLVTPSYIRAKSTGQIAFPVQAEGEWDDWDDSDWEDEDWEYDLEEKQTQPLVRYNRVEGVTLGIQMNKEYGERKTPTRPIPFGSWAYAFAAKEFQYQIGMEKGFTNTNRLAIGGEYHRMIDTPDAWFLKSEENSVAAFLVKEDFHDFYFRDGWSAYLSQNLWKALTLTAGYQSEQCKTVEKNTNWSLFGGDKFRENPVIDEGDLKSLFGKLDFDTRNSARNFRRGWHIQAEGEFTLDDFETDFPYDRVMIDIRRYQPMGFSDNVNFRVRAGSAKGTVPWQKSFYLGGIGTLRGYHHKEFPAGPMEFGGNRMLLAQLEYNVGESVMTEYITGGFPFFHLILFADGGWVGQADSGLGLHEGFDMLNKDNFKSDVGIALANQTGDFRVELAKRTDTGYKPYMFWFRFNRTF